MMNYMSYAKDYFESFKCWILDAMAIGETVRKDQKSWSIDENRERNCNGIFLVIDEFAALRIALDKKEFDKSMTV